MQPDMWDSDVSDHVQKMFLETLDRVAKSDPVKGEWHGANTDTGTVWCDASSLAIGVSVQIDGQLVEDALRMKKPDDCTHINVAELEAVVKGLNLALNEIYATL